MENKVMETVAENAEVITEAVKKSTGKSKYLVIGLSMVGTGVGIFLIGKGIAKIREDHKKVEDENDEKVEDEIVELADQVLDELGEEDE